MGWVFSVGKSPAELQMQCTFSCLAPPLCASVKQWCRIIPLCCTRCMPGKQLKRKVVSVSWMPENCDIYTMKINVHWFQNLLSKSTQPRVICFKISTISLRSRIVKSFLFFIGQHVTHASCANSKSRSTRSAGIWKINFPCSGRFSSRRRRHDFLTFGIRQDTGQGENYPHHTCPHTLRNFWNDHLI